MKFKVECLGRVSQTDILDSMREIVYNTTVLWLKKKLHIILLMQVKRSIFKKEKYQIQNINSIHSKMKKWGNNSLNGVATKYLQNNMNWSPIKEKFKENEFIAKTIYVSMSNIYAINNYRLI